MITVTFNYDGATMTFSHPIQYRKKGKCNLLVENIPFFSKSMVFDFYTREIHIILTGLCSKTEKTIIEGLIFPDNEEVDYDGKLSLQIEDADHVYEKYENNIFWFTSCTFTPVEGINLHSFNMDLLIGESY